ncbi:uncharacterized protein LMH87_008389 [Akanthomyces muscarius]|uniref:Dienelactone hydrolase domain-containing protein n=1 Tax=Akanthomyces muscarius TaxID=2231603 RepID=A0A9W8QIL3_AKAMU|nr:uncharacterized protein LMH87_008389 [Akanthomyces muscarius]KAJ4159489.1 hypothetical protein LMH87_008389 [Akanthomyces muscarius]
MLLKLVPSGTLCLAFAALACGLNSSVYDPLSHPMFQLSPDEETAFFLESVLSFVAGAGASTAEVLRVATQIVPGSEESVHDAFYAMAQSIHALAESTDPRVDPAGARENYFHASSYYRAAATFLVGDQEDPRLISLWDKQIADFDKAAHLLKPPAEPFNVKAKNSSIGAYRVPGYFFRASSNDSKKLPTVLVTTGYDGDQQGAYHALCTQVLLRGMNCVVYEGPGQPSPRRYQNLTFIPDWWTATSPVVDHIVSRPDVDASKIILLGYSFGGTLAPLAAAYEPRISAVVAIDGLSSLQQDLKVQFGSLTGLFEAGKVDEFNKYLLDLSGNKSEPINKRYVIQQGLYAFNTKSPFDWFTRLGAISITPAIVERMGPRPVYIANGQDDTRLLNQSNIAYDQFVNGRRNGKALTYFHEFPVRLGSGEHCSLGAETQLFTSVVGWLSKVWGGYRFSDNQ